MKGLLLLIFVLSVFSISAYAEDVPFSASQTTNVPKIKKWYFGGALGLADMGGWDAKPNRDYYNSLGYYHTGGSSWLFMAEVKFYGGYRMRDYMDVEMGFAHSETQNSDTFENGTNIVWSRRKTQAQALHLAALFRPPYDGYGHGLFLKLGGHVSQLQVNRSVTGNPSNLNAIAAGDHIPEDGSSTGFGPLFGFGFDFRTGKVGAIRLAIDHYYRLGGTSHQKDSVNLGYHGSF